MIAEALKGYLWSLSVSESRAAGIAHQLSTAAVLTPEERDFAGDVVRPDEARHGRWARASARSLGSCDGLTSRSYSPDEFPDAIAALARLNFGEVFFLRYFRQLATVLRAVQRPDLVAGYLDVLADEQRHTAWGRAVLERARGEIPGAAAVIAQHRTMRGHPDRDKTTGFGSLYRSLREKEARCR